jgi:hypothetical protein
MRRFGMFLALFGAAALAVSSLAADGPRKENPKALTEKEIGKMMKDTHRGEKSAYSRTQVELKKDTPDWDQIAKDVKAFSEMGTALRGHVAYTSPAKYIASTEALGKAAKDKNKKAATEAFVGLTNSCGSCHYGGARAMLK